MFLPAIPCKKCIVKPTCSKKHCSIVEENKIKRIVFFKYDLTVFISTIDFFIICCFIVYNLQYPEIFPKEIILIPFAWILIGVIVAATMSVNANYLFLTIACGPFGFVLIYLFPELKDTEEWPY